MALRALLQGVIARGQPAHDCVAIRMQHLAVGRNRHDMRLRTEVVLLRSRPSELAIFASLLERGVVPRSEQQAAANHD